MPALPRPTEPQPGAAVDFMASRTDLTYRYECWRALASGIIETAGTTFLILIAVRYFAAGMLAKGLVAGGGSLGYLLSPWLVARVENSRQPVTRAAARMALLGAVSFLIMALAPVIPVFVTGAMLAMACSTGVLPLTTQVYQENYPAGERGRRFATTVMIRIATATLFGLAAGAVLSATTHIELAGHVFLGHLGYFRWLLAGFAGAFVFAAWCFHRIPSRPLVASGGTHPFRALKHFYTDRLFRQTLIAWMLLGFANLMMLPLRVEYLANPKYDVTLRGAALSAELIAGFTVVLPNVARLIMNPVWGRLFDRMNFFVLRIVLNFGFVVGILAFFTSDTLTGLAVGALLYGTATAGGDVAWSLWVTKFAPPDRVADYMAVHTFFTGVRGLLAPLAAFYLASRMSLPAMGWLSAGMILAGTVFLFPEIKYGRRPQPAAAPLTEEIHD